MFILVKFFFFLNNFFLKKIEGHVIVINEYT